VPVSTAPATIAVFEIHTTVETALAPIASPGDVFNRPKFMPLIEIDWPALDARLALLTNVVVGSS
jgi:hypothetical protein